MKINLQFKSKGNWKIIDVADAKVSRKEVGLVTWHQEGFSTVGVVGVTNKAGEYVTRFFRGDFFTFADFRKQLPEIVAGMIG